LQSEPDQGTTATVRVPLFHRPAVSRPSPSEKPAATP
jgi:hypothetical protein